MNSCMLVAVCKSVVLAMKHDPSPRCGLLVSLECLKREVCCYKAHKVWDLGLHYFLRLCRAP